MVAARGLPQTDYNRIRKLVAEERKIKLGEDAIDYLLDQLIEMLMHSANVDEIFAEDFVLRRKMRGIRCAASSPRTKRSSSRFRGQLKHVQEGSAVWEVEYRRMTRGNQAAVKGCETGVRSMTGFGVGDAPLGDGRVTVELRALNHRFLDVRVRLPEELVEQSFFIEQLARESLARRPLRHRGPARGGGSAAPVVFGGARACPVPRSEPTAGRARAWGRNCRSPRSRACRIWSPPRPARTPRAPGAALKAAFENRPWPTRRDARPGGLGAAAGAARAPRLSAASCGRRSLPAAEKCWRANRIRLRERLERLLAETGVQLDAYRLETEIVDFGQTAATWTEELVRLDSHFDQFAHLLAAEGPVGRRLDFLLQEESVENRIQLAPQEPRCANCPFGRGDEGRARADSGASPRMSSEGPLPLIVSSPSGAGKTTLTARLLEEIPTLRFSVSHTTRKPRRNEQNGREYHFVDSHAVHPPDRARRISRVGRGARQLVRHGQGRARTRRAPARHHLRHRPPGRSTDQERSAGRGAAVFHPSAKHGDPRATLAWPREVNTTVCSTTCSSMKSSKKPPNSSYPSFAPKNVAAIGQHATQSASWPKAAASAGTNRLR